MPQRRVAGRQVYPLDDRLAWGRGQHPGSTMRSDHHAPVGMNREVVVQEATEDVGFKGTIQDLLKCNPSVPADQLPASCRGVSQSISHFQFFFSLGQTF